MMAIKTFLSFPQEVLSYAWAGVAPVFFNLVSGNPRPLERICQVFCSRLAMLLNDGFEDLGNLIMEFFGRSNMFQLRQMYSRMASSLAIANKDSRVVTNLWQICVQLSKDPVDSVRASVAPYLIRFRRYFGGQPDTEREKEVIALFMSFADDPNPYIQDTWSNNWKIFNYQHRESIGEMTQSASAGFENLPKAKQDCVAPSMTSEPRIIRMALRDRRKGGAGSTMGQIIGGQRIISRPRVSKSPSTMIGSGFRITLAPL
jgi:hypothetical protein